MSDPSDRFPSAPVPAFSLELGHGSCVGIAIPEALTAELRAALLPEEIQVMETLGPARQSSFAAGRVALRLALDRAGLAGARPEPLLVGDRGEPLLPPGATGSISHKRNLAVALAAAARSPAGDPLLVGIDLEEKRRLVVDISRRVLTQGELARWMDISISPDRDHDLITIFSLKEALYKAVNGFLKRFVSWRAVEVVSIDPQGGVRFAGSLLDENPDLAVEGWVGCPSPSQADTDRFILSTVRACWRARA